MVRKSINKNKDKTSMINFCIDETTQIIYYIYKTHTYGQY